MTILRILLAAGPMAPAGWALSWLVQSSALLALGLVAGRVVRRSGPAVQSAVFRTALAAVLACPIAAALLVAAGSEGLAIRLPDLTAPPPAGLTASLAAIAVGADAGSRREPLHERSEPPGPTVDSPGQVPYPLGRQEGLAGPSPRPVPERPRFDVLGVVAASVLVVWALGSAVLAVRLVVGLRRMAHLRSSSTRAEPEAGLCGDLARRMGLAPPAVLRTPFLSSPCLCGLRRPAILLPDDAREDLRETLVHELAHLARRDVLWNLLRQSATAALWVQPLLWVVSRRMEAAAEHT